MPRHSVKEQTAFINTVPRNDVHVNHLLTYLPTNLLTSGKTKAAFTLAEVLITLAIIGVVAAMTMPSLIAKQNEKATVVALKKFYNRVEQNLRMNYAIDDEDFTPENFLKRFHTIKICKNTRRGCADEQYYFTDGEPNVYWGKNDNEGRTYAILKDGMIIRLSLTSPDCSQTNTGGLTNVCGEFSVDVNGKKGPNTAGRDLFYFYLTKKRVVPVGEKEHPAYSFDKCCFNSDYNRGFGCAAWVLYNGNLDYLHCKDKLGWDKASSCKEK